MTWFWHWNPADVWHRQAWSTMLFLDHLMIGLTKQQTIFFSWFDSQSRPFHNSVDTGALNQKSCLGRSALTFRFALSLVAVDIRGSELLVRGLCLLCGVQFGFPWFQCGNHFSVGMNARQEGIQATATNHWKRCSTRAFREWSRWVAAANSILNICRISTYYLLKGIVMLQGKRKWLLIWAFT